MPMPNPVDAQCANNQASREETCKIPRPSFRYVPAAVRPVEQPRERSRSLLLGCGSGSVQPTTSSFDLVTPRVRCHPQACPNRTNTRRYTHQRPQKRPTADPRLLEMIELRASLKELKDELRREKERVDRVETAYARDSTRYTLMATRKQQLEEEVRLWKKAAEDLRDSNIKYQMDVEKGEQENFDLQKQLQAYEKKMEHYDYFKARETELVERIETIHEGLSVKFARKERELEVVRGENRDLKISMITLQASQRRLTEMESATAALDSTIIEMKAQLAGKDSSNTKLIENIALHELTIADLNAQVKSSGERIASSEQRIEDLNTQLEARDVIIASSKQKIEVLNAQLEGSDSRVAQLTRLEDQFEVVERECKFAKEKAKNLEKDNANLTAIANIVQEESALYTSELAAGDENLMPTPADVLRPTGHDNPAQPLEPDRETGIRRKRPKRRDKLVFKRLRSQPRRVRIEEHHGSRALRIRSLQRQLAGQEQSKLLGWDHN